VILIVVRTVIRVGARSDGPDLNTHVFLPLISSRIRSVLVHENKSDYEGCVILTCERIMLFPRTF